MRMTKTNAIPWLGVVRCHQFQRITPLIQDHQAKLHTRDSGPCRWVPVIRIPPNVERAMIIHRTRNHTNQQTNRYHNTQQEEPGNWIVPGD